MIQTIQNNSVTFNITPYLTDRGWRIISPSSLKHISENSGDLEIKSFAIQAGKTYRFSLSISSISNGILRVLIGGTPHSDISTTGYHEGTITATDDSKITLFSDADLEMTSLDITEVSSEEDVDGKIDTVTWSEERSRWVTFKDLVPDCGFSMYTNLFTIKDGRLWVHTTEGTEYNNFYGVQYSSSIKFPVVKVAGVKTYQSIAIHSNRVIGTTEDGIETQLGHVSDLIPQDFSTKEGIHYANFWRDKLTDLVNGDRLRGRYVVIELSDKSSSKLQIFKIVVKSSAVTPNE